MAEIVNREQWLWVMRHTLTDRLFKPAGIKVPEKIRLSVGFPKGSRGKGATAIGQCWSSEASADGTFEIFIHPEIVDPIRAGDIIVHEIVHTVAGIPAKHGKAFREIALAVGLTGKMTATVAGDALRKSLEEWAKEIGPYPHAALTPLEGLGGTKTQGTRMLKLTCPSCAYAVRTSQKWIDVGYPVCPCGETLIPEGGEGDGDGD